MGIEEVALAEKWAAGKERRGKGETAWLGGLRGVSCLAVLYGHLNMHDTPNFVGISHHAVMLFFVLSAFLITHRSLEEASRLRTRTDLAVFWSKYACNRFFRVYPLYITVIVLIELQPPLRVFYLVPNFCFSHHLFLSDTMHIFWTIAAEMGYYVFIPFFVSFYLFLVRLGGAAGRWAAAVLLAGSLVCLTAYCNYNFTHEVPYYWWRRYFSVFFSGSVAGVIYFEARRFEQARGHIHIFGEEDRRLGGGCTRGVLCALSRKASDFFCFGILLFFTLIATEEYRRALSLEGVITRVHDGPLFALMLLLGIYSGGGAFSRLFEWNFLLFTGERSFSIYLIHPFWVKLMQSNWKYFIPGFDVKRAVNGEVYFFAFLWTTALTLVVSEVTYRCIEKPGMRFGRYLGKEIGRFLDQHKDQREKHKFQV